MSMQTLRKQVRVLLGAAAAVSIAIIALAGSIGAAAQTLPRALTAEPAK